MPNSSTSPVSSALVIASFLEALFQRASGVPDAPPENTIVCECPAIPALAVYSGINSAYGLKKLCPMKTAFMPSATPWAFALEA